MTNTITVMSEGAHEKDLIENMGCPVAFENRDEDLWWHPSYNTKTEKAANNASGKENNKKNVAFHSPIEKRMLHLDDDGYIRIAELILDKIDGIEYVPGNSKKSVNLEVKGCFPCKDLGIYRNQSIDDAYYNITAQDLADFQEAFHRRTKRLPLYSESVETEAETLTREISRSVKDFGWPQPDQQISPVLDEGRESSKIFERFQRNLDKKLQSFLIKKEVKIEDSTNITSTPQLKSASKYRLKNQNHQEKSQSRIISSEKPQEVSMTSSDQQKKIVVENIHQKSLEFHDPQIATFLPLAGKAKQQQYNNDSYVKKKKLRKVKNERDIIAKQLNYKTQSQKGEKYQTNTIIDDDTPSGVTRETMKDKTVSKMPFLETLNTNQGIKFYKEKEIYDIQDVNSKHECSFEIRQNMGNIRDGSVEEESDRYKTHIQRVNSNHECSTETRQDVENIRNEGVNEESDRYKIHIQNVNSKDRRAIDTRQNVGNSRDGSGKEEAGIYKIDVQDVNIRDGCSIETKQDMGNIRDRSVKEESGIYSIDIQDANSKDIYSVKTKQDVIQTMNSKHGCSFETKQEIGRNRNRSVEESSGVYCIDIRDINNELETKKDLGIFVDEEAGIYNIEIEDVYSKHGVSIETKHDVGRGRDGSIGEGSGLYEIELNLCKNKQIDTSFENKSSIILGQYSDDKSEKETDKRKIVNEIRELSELMNSSSNIFVQQSCKSRILKLEDTLNNNTEGIKVRAPADLPPGYSFPVKIDKKEFIAVVPDGQGVRKGEVFSHIISCENSLHQEDYIVYDEWRDGIFDCFNHGFIHPMLLNGLFCPQIALAQVMSRLKLTWSCRRDDSSRAFRNAVTFTIFLCALNAIPFFIHVNETLYAWISIAILDVLCFIYFTSVLIITRIIFREKYNIPDKRILGFEGFQDTLLALFCPTFTVMQLGRHSSNYHIYSAKCCTPNGLPQHAKPMLPPSPSSLNYTSMNNTEII